MKTTLSISGLKELDDQLGEFTKATARNVLLRAGKDALQPMAQRMRELVHRRTGETEESIDIVALPSTAAAVGKAAYAQAMAGGASAADAGAAAHAVSAAVSGGGLSVLLAVGPTGKEASAKAHLEEFGTAHSRPAPFIRPAFDETVNQAVASVGTALGQEIDKAKARAAAKAARAAAKG